MVGNCNGEKVKINKKGGRKNRKKEEICLKYIFFKNLRKGLALAPELTNSPLSESHDSSRFPGSQILNT